MPEYALIPLLVIAAFLVGSIPFGFLIGRSKGVDIRTQGSGNIGASNLGRILGKKYFAICFTLDFTKGLIPSLVAGALLNTLGSMDMTDTQAWAWLAVMFASPIGHMFTPWLGFKGGKGVATGLGSLLGVLPAMTLPAVGAAVVFIVVLSLWRMIGVASSAAAATLPLWTWQSFRLYETTQERRFGEQPRYADMPAEDLKQMFEFQGTPFLIAASVLAVIVIYKHRGNLQRAMLGTEPKIGSSSEPTPPAPPTTEPAEPSQ
ncbi:MAG: glycerol-3-phosphate acyltransferase [Phycisphaerales bacterium]|nr:glycerol-3-phosphate acyltransferase [Phycisphaerales bacterium]